jgi:hypothetical protein
MSQIEHKEFTADLQLTAIELIRGGLVLPEKPTVSLSTFNFVVNLETRADSSKKAIFIIVSVEIKSEDQQIVMGSLTASCMFIIMNFEELIKIDEARKISMPAGLSEILSSISISTTRGLMFSTFKGTFLHNAVLPILNPRDFVIPE